MRSAARILSVKGAFLSFALLASTSSAFGQVWTRVTWPDWGWSQVVSSADGVKLVAVAFYGPLTSDYQTPSPPPGAILISTNSGITWIQSSAPATFWSGVACSSDGTTIVAASNGDPIGSRGPIYTSTNSGATWVRSSEEFEGLSAVACSADGRLLVAANASLGVGGIFVSKDGGPWALTSAPREAWISLVASADGNKLLAMNYQFPNQSNAAPYWISTNSGGTWAATPPPPTFTEIATSADGSLAVAVVQSAGIYISTNSWATSSPIGITGTNGEWWLALASLTEGGRLLAFTVRGGIYLTTGNGVAWTLVPAPDERWTSIACSTNGAKLAATGDYFVARNFGLYSGLSVPALSVNQLSSKNTVLLSWPVTIPSLGLQQSFDLTSTNWAAMTNTVITTNGLIQALAPVSSGSKFYRLKSQ